MRLGLWSQVQKNVSVMHVKGNNQTQRIISLQEKVAVAECERNLNFLVSSDGTWYEQVNSAASKANRVLGLTMNKISSWSNEIAGIIYPTFVRLHLEFASSTSNSEYDTKARRERGEFIQIYKIVHGL